MTPALPASSGLSAELPRVAAPNRADQSAGLAAGTVPGVRGRHRIGHDCGHIDDRRVVDVANAEHARGLDRLMSLEGQVRANRPSNQADFIEACRNVLARTAGQALITDDNMGTPWRRIWDTP